MALSLAAIKPQLVNTHVRMRSFNISFQMRMELLGCIGCCRTLLRT